MKSQLFDVSNKNIRKSVETKELQLDFWQKVSYYQFALALGYLSVLFPLIFLFFLVKDYFSGFRIELKNEIIWVSPFFAIAAIIYYFILKRRLKLIAIKTNLTREQIGNVIDNICKEFCWSKLRNRKNLIVLKTTENFWSFFAAEQITIIFGSKEILVNSIRDLDAQRKAFGQIGKSIKNLEIIKDEIAAGATSIN